MYTEPPDRPVNTQLKGDELAAALHVLSPVVALYVVTLDEFGANPNVTTKDEVELPLTCACDGAT